MQHLDAGGAVGGVAGGIAGSEFGPGGVPIGAAIGSAIGNNVGGAVGQAVNGIAGEAAKIGQPGTSNYGETDFTNSATGGYNPAQYQGQWNNASDPFSTANMAAGAAGASTTNQDTAASLNGQPGMAGFNQAQAGQSGLEGLLGQEATGQLSLSTAQGQAAQQTNAANTMAMEAQQHGMNPSMAAIDAGQAVSGSNNQAQQNELQAGIAEREGAAGQLGNVLNQQGNLGLNAAGTQAGMQQQSGLANQAATNQMVQYYTSQGMSQEQAQLQANLTQQQIAAGSYNQTQTNATGQSEANAKNNAGMFGSLLSGAGSVGATALSALAVMHSGGVVPEPMHGHLVDALMSDGGVAGYTGYGDGGEIQKPTGKQISPDEMRAWYTDANPSTPIPAPHFNAMPNRGEPIAVPNRAVGDRSVGRAAPIPAPAPSPSATPDPMAMIQTRLQGEPALAQALMGTSAPAGGNVNFSDGGELTKLPDAIILALRDHGGRIPGEKPEPYRDTVTDGRIGLAPGEVVVPEHNEEYPRALRAVTKGKGRRMAEQAAGRAG